MWFDMYLTVHSSLKSRKVMTKGSRIHQIYNTKYVFLQISPQKTTFFPVESEIDVWCSVLWKN